LRLLWKDKDHRSNRKDQCFS